MSPLAHSASFSHHVPLCPGPGSISLLTPHRLWSHKVFSSLGQVSALPKAALAGPAFPPQLPAGPASTLPGLGSGWGRSRACSSGVCQAPKSPAEPQQHPCHCLLGSELVPLAKEVTTSSRAESQGVHSKSFTVLSSSLTLVPLLPQVGAKPSGRDPWNMSEVSVCSQQWFGSCTVLMPGLVFFPVSKQWLSHKG